MKPIEMSKLVIDKMKAMKTFPSVRQDQDILMKSLYSVADRGTSVDDFYEELIEQGFITLETVIKTSKRYRVSKIWSDHIQARFDRFMCSIRMLREHMQDNKSFEYEKWVYTNKDGNMEKVFQSTELKAIEKYGGINAILDDVVMVDKMFVLFKQASEEVAMEKFAPVAKPLLKESYGKIENNPRKIESK